MPGPATRVLVADDDASLVQTLTWILKENGYEVAVCPGGEGLFAKLEEIKPALLLLDIMMPKVDGLQLLERLKQDERYRDLPVLMVSSMPPEEATVRALGLGAADFISKPFRVRELLARVEAHIRVGRALAQAREEARSRAAMVDILHEVTDSLKPDEMYHILARRVARALNISKCSMVLAKPGDQQGVVVAAYENPMLRNLQIELGKYPEIRKAVSTGRLVLVEDVATDPLYEDERRRWERDEIKVPTRSAVALPFWMKDQQIGVFFLRTTGDDPPLTRADAQFAETVIKTAVSAIEKAYDFESAVSDKQRLEKLASTDALTGCMNRRALAEALAQELDRARRYSLALTVMLADLDRFKSINDTRGHIAGDSVLRQVGAILRRAAPTIACTAPTASCRSLTRPSIAPRTKGATWCGNERAALPQVRICVHRYRGTLLSQRRQHARGDPGQETGDAAVLRQRDRRAHAAASRQGRPGPRVHSLESDPRRPLSGHEEAGRGRDVVRLSRQGDLVGRHRRAQGAVAAPGVRQELRRAPAPRGGARDAPRPSQRLPHPAAGRVRGRAHLSGDAIPQGRAAVRSGSARRPDGDCIRRDAAQANVCRPASRARVADHSSRSQARKRHAGAGRRRRRRTRRRHGLRVGQGAARRPRHRQADGNGHHPRHARVHEPRADPRQAARRAQRHLRARHRGVRDVHRQAAVPGPERAGDDDRAAQEPAGADSLAPLRCA